MDCVCIYTGFSKVQLLEIRLYRLGFCALIESSKTLASKSVSVSTPDTVYVSYPFLYVKKMGKNAFFLSFTDFPWYEKIKTALQNKFKLPKFRSLQLETVNATMAGKDIFLVMPTGGGKSLCYQLPAVCSDGMYEEGGPHINN